LHIFLEALRSLNTNLFQKKNPRFPKKNLGNCDFILFKKQMTKIIVLSYCKPELFEFWLKCVSAFQGSLQIFSSFQSNLDEWEKIKSLLPKETKMCTTTNVDTIGAENIILDNIQSNLFFNTKGCKEALTNCKNLIVLSSNPSPILVDAILKLVTEIYVPPMNKKDKLTAFHKIIFQKDTDFDTFQTQIKKLTSDQIGKFNLKSNEYSVVAHNMTLKTLDVSLNESLNESLNVSPNDNLQESKKIPKTHKTVQVSGSLSGTSKQLKHQVEEILKNHNFLNKMIVRHEITAQDENVKLVFQIRPKRLDLFRIMLLNVFDALKEGKQITSGGLFV